MRRRGWGDRERLRKTRRDRQAETDLRYLIQLGEDGGGNISVNAQGERRKREKERGDRRIEREAERQKQRQTGTGRKKDVILPRAMEVIEK